MEIQTPLNREFYLSGDINQSIAKDIMQGIRLVNESDNYISETLKSLGSEYDPDPIRINIDSFGGCCYSGMGIIGEIKSSNTPIHTHVVGSAMSMGFIILCAGTIRTANAMSTLMLHEPSISVEGNLTHIGLNLKGIKKLDKRINRVITDNTNLTLSELKKKYKKQQDWYMNSEQSLSYGVIHKII